MYLNPYILIIKIPITLKVSPINVNNKWLYHNFRLQLYQILSSIL